MPQSPALPQHSHLPHPSLHAQSPPGSAALRCRSTPRPHNAPHLPSPPFEASAKNGHSVRRSAVFGVEVIAMLHDIPRQTARLRGHPHATTHPHSDRRPRSAGLRARSAPQKHKTPLCHKTVSLSSQPQRGGIIEPRANEPRRVQPWVTASNSGSKPSTSSHPQLTSSLSFIALAKNGRLQKAPPHLGAFCVLRPGHPTIQR